jgi:uncharacterized membrane protein
VSRAWLAGLGSVLPITVTVAVLAVVLSLTGRWLCHDSGPLPRDAQGPAAHLRWLCGLLVVAAIVWLVALAWLEARPLPYPTLPDLVMLTCDGVNPPLATVAGFY